MKPIASIPSNQGSRRTFRWSCKAVLARALPDELPPDDGV
jgi:hypothetical protein